METKRYIKDFLFVSSGTFSMALAINLFIANHEFAFGGVSGLAVILRSLLSIPLEVTNLVINIPLFIIGARTKGRMFLLKSVVATAELSFFIYLTNTLHVLHSDNITAAIFGGILMGCGVGLVIIGGGSTGGTEMSALLLNKKFNIPLSCSIFVIDSSVIIGGAFLFGFNNALYSLIVVFGLAQSVKFVTQSFDSISEKIRLYLSSIHILHNPIIDKPKRNIIVTSILRFFL